jgi:prevent-host-death family protein
MKEETITVTEAARNFAECVNRAHYQDVTFVLLKNGEPVARIVPDGKKRYTVRISPRPWPKWTCRRKKPRPGIRICKRRASL